MNILDFNAEQARQNRITGEDKLLADVLEKIKNVSKEKNSLYYKDYITIYVNEALIEKGFRVENLSLGDAYVYLISW